MERSGHSPEDGRPESSSSRDDRKDAVVEAAGQAVLEPLADFPRIDLRNGVEPWDTRRTAGKMLRSRIAHAAHADLVSGPDRPDPVSLIEAAHEGRQPHLIPLRVARMASSPFAFLRGAAQVMAWDLAQGPRGVIDVVMNGDAHIANFGLFGSPQGDVVLDLNDFDEVTVGPWEWDLKRLCASIEVAARDAEVPRSDRREALLSAAAGYQLTMDDLAPRGSLDVWQRASRADDLAFAGAEIDERSRAVVDKAVEKARKKNNQSLLDRVGERRTDGGWRFKEEPPILVRVDEATREAVITGLERYAETLPRERRFMLSRYHVVDVAHRVVGVGSVGTRAYVALLCGNSDHDALFLQVKEAVRPAHAPYLPGMPEPYASHQGERVIYGQRLLQAVGDPLLGWTTIDRRPFYVRQMKNMKGEIPVARMTGQSLLYFSHAYGALLAKAHARTGDAAAIAGYCGHAGRTDLREAIADWAAAYGDRNAEDHATFLKAIESGRLQAADDPCL
ncbi:DUF2252 domain-containing protein [Methylobacterium aerolatum]|uniref:Uncharacterized protein (DUF2252 family) n=1 Tax=Methylobacterium aerolatum TaxID=418708 RepID=A0ABU0HUM6_9HYPH|nr:DUF2252 domain-containing protein [Methylobacterium aerolatum]MDQ0446025.1 uncharacterized protein (DUF2252 family) [Methylobacterium aerolatum]GJD35062.1 hypothetical protein FMGBMHLM_1969 [Methylobacterium aerolatum]